MPDRGSPAVPVQDNPAALARGIRPAVAQGSLAVLAQDNPLAVVRDIPEAPVQDNQPAVGPGNPPAAARDILPAVPVVRRLVERVDHSLVVGELHNHGLEADRAVRTLRLEHRKARPELLGRSQVRRRVDPWWTRW